MRHALPYEGLPDQSELALKSVPPTMHLPHLFHHPSSLQSGDSREGGWTEPRVDAHEGENIGRVYGADTGRGEQRGGGAGGLPGCVDSCLRCSDNFVLYIYFHLLVGITFVGRGDWCS